MAITLAGDWAEFASGPFRAVNNVWNKGNLRNGPDFTQSVTYEPTTFPDGVTLQWSWPGFNEEIWAYPEVIVGYKPWDRQDGTLALSARVDHVKQLEAHFDLAIAGETDEFNVALEFWLTDKKGGGPKSITTEVMVWLHNGDLTPAGGKSGRYEGDGYGASIFVEKAMTDRSGDSEVRWKYIALKADADLLSGSIDLRDLLIALRKQGLIDGRDFIGGFELGAEVAGGAGTLAIGELGYAFAKYDITRGDDLLAGTGGDDLIDGRGGGDALSGGLGNDDTGRDSFVFDAALDLANVDRIADFKPGKDRIVLDDAVFVGLGVGSLSAGAFHVGKTAVDSGDRIVHDRKAGILSFDPDGTGVEDAVVFARIDRGLDISAADFLVV